MPIKQFSHGETGYHDAISLKSLLRHLAEAEHMKMGVGRQTILTIAQAFDDAVHDATGLPYYDERPAYNPPEDDKHHSRELYNRIYAIVSEAREHSRKYITTRNGIRDALKEAKDMLK